MHDRSWNHRKLYELVYGRAMVDPESTDGLRDDPYRSWYQLRCGAIDHGRPDLVLDAIQMEQSIEMLPDPLMRAALLLHMMGWDEHEIGAVLNQKRRGMTASSLIKSAIREIVKQEKIREDLRIVRD